MMTMNADKGNEDIFKHVIVEKNLMHDGSPSIDLFNLDYFRERIALLMESFPESFFTHALALKGNSLRGVLRIAKASGLGGECASFPEAIHALSVGFEPQKVVFDSPCKTKADIKAAIEAGIIMNLDNEYEASIVDQLLNNECRDFEPPIIGMRVNPVVGGGKIGMMSTATKLSKFGVPLTEETKDRVLDLYKMYSWLNGIHFHVGSQGVPIQLFVDGARVVMDFVKEIESATGRRLASIDIGGGLSSSYTSPEEPGEFTFLKYRKLLDNHVPELFSGKYKIITEFGRSLLLKAGKSLSRINYIKHWLPEFVQPICLLHFGTNQFVREVYLPHLWNHRITALDGKTGTNKQSDETLKYDLAGPLCFQGDFLAHNVEMPKLEQNDVIVIHETGGYTMSMYSRYNSITPSAVYAYEKNQSGNFRIYCFKERETPEETLSFWGNSYPRIVN